MYNLLSRNNLNFKILKLKLNNLLYYHSTVNNNIYGLKLRKRNTEKLSPDIINNRIESSNLFRWIDAYRSHGHRTAKTNPIEVWPTNRDPSLDELNPEYYGLNSQDVINNLNGILYNVNTNPKTVNELKQILDQIYCSSMCSIEFNYIEDSFEREWLAEHYEAAIGEELSSDYKKKLAELMLQFQGWDHFLAIKFPTVKRYGGEGAESMVSFFKEIINESAHADVTNIVLGMPHRGRLNLLTTLLNKRPSALFRLLKGAPEFPKEMGVYCDHISHNHTSVDLPVGNKTVHLSMLRNPSHLEAVNPVAMGKTLSKQQQNLNTINILVHGDAAFPGQGINQECLMMNGTPHFCIGGVIHLITNNQLGFTLPAERARYSRYCTDLAKSINAPVLHVNGDDPEMLVKLTRLAFQYRQRFDKDIFIDLQCFRRWGHNELDDPTFTNPTIYKIIHNRKSVPDLYAEKLIDDQLLTAHDVKIINDEYREYLNAELKLWDSVGPEKCYFEQQWSGFELAPNTISIWDTGIDYGLLQYIGKSSVNFPKTFAIHPHLLKTFVTSRLKRLSEGKSIDWATAESLAIGSLMYQRHNVRLSGEDVGRGTFSHRHAMLVDQSTGETFIPLNSMEGGCGGKFEVANSILSEEAVLGFEYGMAIDNPKNLVIWEAQFGDFNNCAQTIFDTFICSGETKWMYCNGLVVLLPHGYDGAASEHSSSRYERFLQMTDSKETSPDGDNVNLNIINPTTPAQYFHALRRQIIRNFRKPLVVIAPKILLRLPQAVSAYTEFQPGTYFQTVLGDSSANPNDVTRVILCSGRHYYTLNDERQKRNIKNVAIIRLESLCPFPSGEIIEELRKYKSAREFIWAQEEHRNMGAWTFVSVRFENIIGRKLKYCGRVEAPTPAVGVSSWHLEECKHIAESPFQ